MSSTLLQPGNREIVSTSARTLATGDVREWRPEKFARRPLSPPEMLRLRDVDILIIEDRCKGCSYCIEFCPKDVLEEDKRLNVRGVHPPRVRDIELCVGCGICEELCPDLAIFLVDKEKQH